MKTRFLIAVSAGVLALAACGKKNDVAMNGGADTNIAIDNGAEMNVAAPAADPTTTQGFANMAAASDRFEIESSKMAETSASSAAIKKFAAKMITDHGQSTATLKSLASGMSPPLTPDDTLTADQQSTLTSLKGKTGKDFDSAYAAAQVDGHQKALDGLKTYSASGENAALKDFAKQMIPIVTAHLNLAKGLK